MRTRITNGIIVDVCTGHKEKADLLIQDGLIAKRSLHADDVADVEIDAQGAWLLPGLVDVHTHGCAGYDFSTADFDGYNQMSRFYRQHGVTTVIPTLASATMDDWMSALQIIRECQDRDSLWQGVHFEGRYLNPQKRGAHAASLLSPLNANEIPQLVKSVRGCCHVTAALELDDVHHSFLHAALESGATVGLGHTMATFKEAQEAFQAGATSATHLFNAMPPLHHREGGTAAAALLDEHVYCELIVDGLHIAKEMVCLAERLKQDHLVLITDSMEGTGCEDGVYAIAGERVLLQDGIARTTDGALAGSTLTLDKAVQNLMMFTGIPLERAWYAASMAPAKEMGIDRIVGSLDNGKHANIDFVYLDEQTKQLTIQSTMIDGQIVLA